MKYFSLGLLVVLCLWTTVALYGQDEALPDVTNTYVLRNVNIITSPGKMIKRGAVVIKDGLIHAVGQQVDVPYQAKEIDADSMYLYAGFIDGLSHAGLKKEKSSDDSEARGRRRRPDVDDPGNPPPAMAGIQPQRAVSSLLDPSESELKKLRELGFTAAHIVPEEGMLPGMGALVLLAGDQPEAMVLRDKVSLFSKLDPARGVYPATVIGVMSKWRELYRQARQAQTHETLYANAPEGMARPTHDPILSAFQPVLDGRLPVFFMAEDIKSIHRAFSLQRELGFPLVLAGVKEGWRVADVLKNSDTPVFLALELPDSPKKGKEKEDGEKDSMSKEKKELEARRAEFMKDYESQAAAFAKQGIPFGFASAGAKSKDIKDNLRRMVGQGLSEEQALAALTTVPAKTLGVDKVMGTVEKGKIANLVISDKPYFEEKAKVRYVFVDGRLFEYEAKENANKSADPSAVASAAGTWSYKINIPGQSMEGTLTLVDNDGALEGSVSNSQMPGSTQIRDGAVDDRRLSFSISYDAGGQTITTFWELEIDGDTLEGTVSAGEYGRFDVEGERVGPGSDDDRQTREEP